MKQGQVHTERFHGLLFSAALDVNLLWRKRHFPWSLDDRRSSYSSIDKLNRQFIHNNNHVTKK